MRRQTHVRGKVKGVIFRAIRCGYCSESELSEREREERTRIRCVRLILQPLHLFIKVHGDTYGAAIRDITVRKMLGTRGDNCVTEQRYFSALVLIVCRVKK